jgi:AAA15 family ATPase/GTPase
MIIDFSISNFRSFKDDQMLSMLAEGARGRHPSNYTLIEGDRYAVLRSATILGANASGKSNILRALAALRWIVVSSSGRKDGQSIPPYEPFRLSLNSEKQPVKFEIEFVVPSGTRYRYEVAYRSDRILEERLFSFAKRSRALVFDRGMDDTWETVAFGATHKGGKRKFSFFENASYLSRAGNDAAAPQFIREIHRYFESMVYVPAGRGLLSKTALNDAEMMRAVSELICLADTGVTEVTLVENELAREIQLPDEMPDDVKELIIAQNRLSTKFWIKSQSGDLVSFDSDDMSEGTIRLVELLPMILDSFKNGSVVILDEINAHLHTDLVNLILQLFHDDDVNAKRAQIIFSTHDTNILDPVHMRRDQIWFVSKEEGVSSIKSLDEYDKQYVRPDSPFEAFYRDGRLGALPRLSFGTVKQALLSVLRQNESAEVG